MRRASRLAPSGGLTSAEPTCADPLPAPGRLRHTPRYHPAPRERCPSGLRSATGNPVRAERCVAGSNPALSVFCAAPPPAGLRVYPTVMIALSYPGAEPVALSLTPPLSVTEPLPVMLVRTCATV